jgi:polyisoprenoid-binding protein YceI
MKFVKILILMAVCLGLGVAGGFYEGFKYGKKSAEANQDFKTVVHGNVVELTPPAPATPAATPAPAPVATPAAPAPAAAPAAPAPAAAGWENIGTKTMSQQAVIDLPEESAPAAAAPAAAPAPAPAAAPAAGATVYEISADDSTLDFTGYKEVLGEKAGMSGMFGGFSGTVNVPGDNLEQMSFDVAVKTATINTENAILTGVLKSSLFFDATAFPEAKLVSQKIVKQDDKYVATVAWTMRDKTVGYELPLTVKQSGNSITATCEVFIDRNLWHLGPEIYENKDIGISVPILPEVKVKFEMVANKK